MDRRELLGAGAGLQLVAFLDGILNGLFQAGKMGVGGTGKLYRLVHGDQGFIETAQFKTDVGQVIVNGARPVQVAFGNGAVQAQKGFVRLVEGVVDLGDLEIELAGVGELQTRLLEGVNGLIRLVDLLVRGGKELPVGQGGFDRAILQAAVKKFSGLAELADVGVKADEVEIILRTLGKTQGLGALGGDDGADIVLPGLFPRPCLRRDSGRWAAAGPNNPSWWGIA